MPSQIVGLKGQAGHSLRQMMKLQPSDCGRLFDAVADLAARLDKLEDASTVETPSEPASRVPQHTQTVDEWPTTETMGFDLQAGDLVLVADARLSIDRYLRIRTSRDIQWETVEITLADGSTMEVPRDRPVVVKRGVPLNKEEFAELVAASQKALVFEGRDLPRVTFHQDMAYVVAEIAKTAEAILDGDPDLTKNVERPPRPSDHTSCGVEIHMQQEPSPEMFAAFKKLTDDMAKRPEGPPDIRTYHISQSPNAAAAEPPKAPPITASEILDWIRTELVEAYPDTYDNAQFRGLLDRAAARFGVQKPK